MTTTVRLKTKVNVAFNGDTVMIQFLGHKVWVRHKPDVDAAIMKMIFSTFRWNPTPVEADVDEVVQAALMAVREHSDFPVWEVHNA